MPDSWHADDFEPLDDDAKRWWWDAPWRLTGPVLGVPGSRPPFYFGGDEYGRRTWVIQLPLLGRLVIAERRVTAVSQERS